MALAAVPVVPVNVVKPDDAGGFGKGFEVPEQLVARAAMAVRAVVLEVKDVEPFVQRKGPDIVQHAGQDGVPDVVRGQARLFADAQGEVRDIEMVACQSGTHHVDRLDHREDQLHQADVDL